MAANGGFLTISRAQEVVLPAVEHLSINYN
jgi:hypothetical protein